MAPPPIIPFSPLYFDPASKHLPALPRRGLIRIFFIQPCHEDPVTSTMTRARNNTPNTTRTTLYHRTHRHLNVFRRVCTTLVGDGPFRPGETHQRQQIRPALPSRGILVRVHPYNATNGRVSAGPPATSSTIATERMAIYPSFNVSRVRTTIHVQALDTLSILVNHTAGLCCPYDIPDPVQTYPTPDASGSIVREQKLE